MKKIAVGIFVFVLFTIGCISVSAEYFICLGSFTVPENAADYQAELSAVGYRTFTDDAIVNGRLFTRVLYRYPFQSYDNARATLKALSQSRVILRNRIYDLWIVSDPVSVSQSSPVIDEPPADGPTVHEPEIAEARESPVEELLVEEPAAAISSPKATIAQESAEEKTSSDDDAIPEPVTKPDTADSSPEVRSKAASSTTVHTDEEESAVAEQGQSDGPTRGDKETTDGESPAGGGPTRGDEEEASGGASGAPTRRAEAEDTGSVGDDGEDWNPVPGNPYKRIHEEGYANCIFAESAIGLGEEDRHQLKNSFTEPDDVYARCYLPGPIGPVEGENFWHEIWIDGKLRGRTFFNEPPEPGWDQIQIWITEDEYSRQMNELGPGEHDIIIWVMKNEYRGERAVAGENAAGEITAEMKEIWVPVRLSKGKFTYTVE